MVAQWIGKANGNNPKRKNQIVVSKADDQSDTLAAASAAELVPNVLGFLSFGAFQQCREGDPDTWATEVLHIICPGLHPGEDTPWSTHSVDTTREAAVTGYKPYC